MCSSGRGPGRSHGRRGMSAIGPAPRLVSTPRHTLSQGQSPLRERAAKDSQKFREQISGAITGPRPTLGMASSVEIAKIRRAHVADRRESPDECAQHVDGSPGYRPRLPSRGSPPRWPPRGPRARPSPQGCHATRSVQGSTCPHIRSRRGARDVHEPFGRAGGRAGLPRLPPLQGARLRPRDPRPRPWKSCDSAPRRRWTRPGVDWPSRRSASAGRRRPSTFDPKVDTVMVVALPKAVAPGAIGVGGGRFHARPAREMGALGAPGRGSRSSRTGIRSSPTTTRRAGNARRSSPGTSPGTRRPGITSCGSTCPKARSIASTGKVTNASPARTGRQVVTIAAEPRARLRAGLLRPASRPASAWSAGSRSGSRPCPSTPRTPTASSTSPPRSCRSTNAGSGPSRPTRWNTPSRSSAGTATNARAWCCSTTAC